MSLQVRVVNSIAVVGSCGRSWAGVGMWLTFLVPAIGWAQPPSPLHFSSEVGFTATDGPHAGQFVSDGDELHTSGVILHPNAALVANFCVKPPPPDFGLDALHLRSDGTVLFSVEYGWFDECLGHDITDGDLLSNAGVVIKTNAELMENFSPKPVVPDVGLDGVHELTTGEIYFSLEMDIFDEVLNVMLKHGDVLSNAGYVVATNEQLMQSFCPEPPLIDYGLDALWLTGDGEIWFSPEEGWFDECLGIFIGEGDLLSELGYVVAKNEQTVDEFFSSAGEVPPVGLDAVWGLPPFAGCGVLEVGPQGCLRFVSDDGGQAYFIENVDGFDAGDHVYVNGLLNPISMLCPPFIAPGIEDNAIGPCFEGCGTLVQGVECVLFETDNGDRYVLDNHAPFTVGDRVWVRGQLEVPCSTPCLEGIGCIHDNFIGFCFEGCGTLVPGPELCPELQTDTGAVYALEDMGPFNFGDRVWVQGYLNPQSQVCPPLTMPGIERNRIGTCFEGCGVLVFIPGLCVGFQTDTGEIWVLDHYGDFSVGDRVWVRGRLDPDCMTFPCLGADGCIRDNTIEPCFEGCGTLVPGPDLCPQLQTDIGEVYALENMWPFNFGDRVWVQGALNPESQLCPPLTMPGIEQNRIGTCFEGCGTLVQGAECVLFETDNGDRYVLENLGSFNVGDRVWVRGWLELGCGTTCQEGIGCIHDNLIGLCFEGCGVITYGPLNCFLFQADSGETYVLDDFGGFGVGDRVWVKGWVEPDPACAGGCIGIVGCIHDNTIEPCFEGCGMLVPGPDLCPQLQTDTGEVYALENMWPFNFGDRVWVQGALNPESQLCPPLTMPGIEDNLVGACLIPFRPMPEDFLGETCANDDECPNTAYCVPPPLGEAGAGVCYVPKNRYVSIDPNPADAGLVTARRVRLDLGGGSTTVLGWLGAPIPLNITGPETTPQLLARLDADPYYRDWSVNDSGQPWVDPTVHVGDCEISPGQTYIISAIVEGADIGDEAMYSQSLVLRTVDDYGDVVGGTVGTPPDGDRSFKDISAVVRGFQSIQTEPKVWLDLRGTPDAQLPDFSNIDFQDIDRAVKGFQGQGYPFPQPCDCPDQAANPQCP